MSRKPILATLTVLLLGILGFTHNFQEVKASGTIYIKADGSIYPLGAAISSADNFTYSFTDDINDSIVVERDNITVDGEGYTLQGTEAYHSKGIDLTGRSNVTIQNMNIVGFWDGVFLNSAAGNTVSRNNITNNLYYGIYLTYSSNNSINENNIMNNPMGIVIGSYSYINNISKNSIRNKDLVGINNGIYLDENSYNNSVNENDVTNNDIGIHIDHSSSNSINGNNITTNKRWGLLIYDFDIFNPNGSSNNQIYHNNFINNTQQAYVRRETHYIWSYRMYGNCWDNSYTFGGNFWSDYGGCDVHSGVYQNETCFDWIGDSPYLIGENDQDNYPLMHPFVPEKEEVRIAYRNLLLKHTEMYSKQEAVINELNTIRNLMYAFMITTVILIAIAVYSAKRKPKIKPQTE